MTVLQSPSAAEGQDRGAFVPRVRQIAVRPRAFSAHSW